MFFWVVLVLKTSILITQPRERNAGCFHIDYTVDHQLRRSQHHNERHPILVLAFSPRTQVRRSAWQHDDRHPGAYECQPQISAQPRAVLKQRSCGIDTCWLKIVLCRAGVNFTLWYRVRRLPRACTASGRGHRRGCAR